MDTMTIERIRRDLKGTPKFTDDLAEADIIDLPVTLRRFIGWILRERWVNCEQAGGLLGVTEKEARQLIADLAFHGLVEHVPTCGIPVYRVCLAPRSLKPPVGLLKRLEDA
ncbi:MAG: hypothetical protein ACLGPL_04695 [Acidobacteriota bacterium]